jgi:hypothetical protein
MKQVMLSFGVSKCEANQRANAKATMNFSLLH